MRKLRLAHNLNSTTGMSLLEIMVAIAVATLAMTALVVVSNTAIRGVDTARGRTTADQFVREGIEQMRAHRDNVSFATMKTSSALVANTDKYYSLNSSGVPQLQAQTGANACLIATSNPATYQIPNSPTYYRIITQRLNTAGDEDLITVTVCYDVRNSKWQSASAQSLLTNWK